MQQLFMHNWYIVASLCIMLQEQHQILCDGATWSNRIGCSKAQIDFKKIDNNGILKVLYDTANKVMVMQWVDNSESCVYYIHLDTTTLCTRIGLLLALKLYLSLTYTRIQDPGILSQTQTREHHMSVETDSMSIQGYKKK